MLLCIHPVKTRFSKGGPALVIALPQGTVEVGVGLLGKAVVAE